MTSDYMQRALAEAKKAVGNVSPNPAVGAVIVNNGRIVGHGHTQPPGSDHAEVVALKQAGHDARGATMYVTLEPCCHYGRTPPCTGAIIASGITEVHMAVIDPNPVVSGKGKVELERHGVTTHVGERETEARLINEAYAKHITTHTPFVTAKFAMSLDGKIATRTFDSRWISNEQSRLHVHRLRWATDAIMVGVNTVLRDNPRLTARLKGKERQPLRVIVDSLGRTPSSAAVLQPPGKALIATTTEAEPSRLRHYSDLGVDVISLPPRDGSVDVGEVLRILGRREITSVLVEGGGTLLGSLFYLGLIEKVVAFIAPMIIGGRESPTPVGGEGVATIAERLRLRRVAMRRFGDDIMITGYSRD